MLCRADSGPVQALNSCTAALKRTIKRMLPIAADTTSIRLVPLVVAAAAAEAVVLVGENEVVAIPPVNVAALAPPVVDGAMNTDPGHCSGNEIVECVGAGKVTLSDITVGWWACSNSPQLKTMDRNPAPPQYWQEPLP
jgi:hypothetical protein